MDSRGNDTAVGLLVGKKDEEGGRMCDVQCSERKNTHYLNLFTIAQSQGLDHGHWKTDGDEVDTDIRSR